MSGQAGEERIASRTKPSGIVDFRRSAHRSVPSAFVRAMFAATAWWTPAVMRPSAAAPRHLLHATTKT
nr:hypothetical protein OG409_37550 [Streptomyces sp. NBC_00974]